jgi:hypothetical protein
MGALRGKEAFSNEQTQPASLEYGPGQHSGLLMLSEK